MFINHNLNALKTQNKIASNALNISKSTAKLSSGLRITKAADDSAGLSISEKMRSQIRGLNQAGRNIQDGISLIQTAEGGLSEIHGLLQRGRELTVQAASDTNTIEDKQASQQEVSSILDEVNHISKSTKFNNINLLTGSSSSQAVNNPLSKMQFVDAVDTNLYPAYEFNTVVSVTPDEQKVLDELSTSMMSNAVQVIKDNYGLEVNDNTPLKILFDNNAGSNAMAYVQYNVNTTTGKGYNLELHINMAYFPTNTWPNGGQAPVFSDRIITHELTHAVMSQNMDFYALPEWFKEGSAEFIHGGDERVYADMSINGVSAVVNSIGNGTDSTWVNDSLHYSSAYSTVRFLHEEIKSAGGNGIKDVMDYLKNNQTATLDDALKNIAHGGYAGGIAGLVQDFKNNGVSFINSFDFNDLDTGAIGGYDVDGGPVKDAASVIPDVENPTLDPTGFDEIWPESFTPQAPVPTGNVTLYPPSSYTYSSGTHTSSGSTTPSLRLMFQISANSGDVIGMDLNAADTVSLGINAVDVVSNSTSAIASFDNAINTVSQYRGYLGAMQNRLEHMMNNINNTSENTSASESRIRDVDMAKEMINYSKSNILLQAAQSLMVQANQEPQSILQLLRQ